MGLKMERIGHARSRKGTAQQWDALIERYIAGEPVYKLAEGVGVSAKLVWLRLQERGIQTRGLSESHRRYACRHDFFRDVRTEAQAYWLGFLAADGSVSHRYVSIGLAAKDRDHLVRFLDSIGSAHKIEDKVYRLHWKGAEKEYPSCRVSIASPEMVNDLASYGIVPRKCQSVPWPTLPDDLLPHYLRGYFDGDGCFSIKRSQILFRMIGNAAFLSDCQQFLMDACRLSVTNLMAAYGSSGLRVLSYKGGGQVARIAALMYQDATIYLPRKRDLIADLLTHPERRGVDRTYCLHGHEMTPENTKIINRKSGKSYRNCRTCANEAVRAWRVKRAG
jgi:hypothetical protein